MKKVVTVFTILAIICALLALACFAYQFFLNEPTAANATLRTLSYNGLPICGVLTVIFAVVAIVTKVKNK